MRIIFLVGILLTAATASRSDSNLSAAVDSAFIAGDYERVELLILRAGTEINGLDSERRTEVLLTGGYALIMLDRESEARDYFQRALDVNRNLRLDPARVSPKFRTVFDEVKANYRPPQKSAPAAPVSRATATSTWLNLAIPGAGQWREGAKGRGAMVAGLQLASIAILIWRLDELSRSRDAYVRETDRSRVPERYDEYDRDTGAVWAAGIAAAAIYLGAQIDLALTRKPAPDLSFSVEPGVADVPTRFGVRLGLTNLCTHR